MCLKVLEIGFKFFLHLKIKFKKAINKLKKVNINLLVGLSAVFMSACALYVSIQQVKIMRSQQKSTMFPYITISTFYNSEGYGIRLKNSGNGLAKINSYKIYNDSIYFRDWFDVLQTLSPKLNINYNNISTVGSIRDEIITPNEEVNLIFLKWTEDSRKFEKYMSSLNAEVCYSSLLEESWIVNQKAPTQIDDKCALEMEKEFGL